MSDPEFPTDLPHASDGLHAGALQAGGPSAFDEAEAEAPAPPVNEDVEIAFPPAAPAPAAVTVAPAATEPGTSAWARAGQEIVAGLKTLVSAAVYATLIVTFGFQVARVDGLSMAPTLEEHDRLIVNKLVYELGEPRPGDIVMLYYPLNPEKMFVKRVIAKEGDAVRIVDGHVYVNDIPLHDDYVPAEFRSHDDWGPQVVQQGYYFVMGDHRNNSSDSRHWGSVPKKYIVGKVKVRWWPLQDAKIF
jgi:signal peptidase I